MFYPDVTPKIVIKSYLLLFKRNIYKLPITNYKGSYKINKCCIKTQ